MDRSFRVVNDLSRNPSDRFGFSVREPSIFSEKAIGQVHYFLRQRFVLRKSKWLSRRNYLPTLLVFIRQVSISSSKPFKEQNRSTEGCSKLKRSVDMTSSGKNGLNIRTNASPKWAGPGVRRSKRPLLASRTRCNVLWKPPKFGNKVNIGIKVQFGNKLANRCNVWSI